MTVTKITCSICFFLNHLQLCVIVQGLYQMEVRLLGYQNPTHTCQDCPVPSDSNGRRRCCDGSSDVTSECDLDYRPCDSYFKYCLRSFGDESASCSNHQKMISSVNRNDQSIDFSKNIVLGLDNPFRLPGLTDDYTVSSLVVLYTIYSMLWLVHFCTCSFVAIDLL